MRCLHGTVQEGKKTLSQSTPHGEGARFESENAKGGDAPVLARGTLHEDDAPLVRQPREGMRRPRAARVRRARKRERQLRAHVRVRVGLGGNGVIDSDALELWREWTDEGEWLRKKAGCGGWKKLGSSSEVSMIEPLRSPAIGDVGPEHWLSN